MPGVKKVVKLPAAVAVVADNTWRTFDKWPFLRGVFALAVRLHLWNPGGGFVSNDAYNKLFTLHGAIMVFLFIIPSVPGALGNFVLPMMLGAFAQLAGAVAGLLDHLLPDLDAGVVAVRDIDGPTVVHKRRYCTPRGPAVQPGILVVALRC